MKQSSIRIIKIVNGGYGLGKQDSGQVVFVRHTLPDELVNVTILEKKKKLLYARVEQILEAHAERRIAPCKYYGICGGCDLQHASYPFQVKIKESLLGDLMQRLGSPEVAEAVHLIQPIHRAPEEFAYRQRIQLKIDNTGRLGYYGFQSNKLIEIESCLLAPPQINNALQFLQSSQKAKKLLTLATEVELLLNPDLAHVTAIFRFSRKPRPADLKNAAELCTADGPLRVIFIKGDNYAPHGPITSTGELDDYDNLLQVTYNDIIGQTFSLQWETGGFCQVNLEQNRQMIEKVVDLAAPSPGDSILDLYCGMGNFSIPLALKGADVTGYEGQGAAIRSARKNAENAGLKSARFFKSPVHDACKKLAESSSTFDTVVIDPPRQGGPELADYLFKLCRKKLIYISCDPATLCRDLNSLTEQGFKIQTIFPVDMFPQTHHIETIVLLTK